MCSFCFVCADEISVDALAHYLQERMINTLIYEQGDYYRFITDNNEQIDIWTADGFNRMRGYKYQMVFIQDKIYCEDLEIKAYLQLRDINDIIPSLRPNVFILQEWIRGK